VGKAIIIGATSGIGRAVAIRLLEKGWTVGISGRRSDALEDIASRYERAVPQQMDITTPDAVSTLDSLLELVGPPDLFLHVSGVGYQNPALDEDRELLMVRTNCEGMVRIVTHFINYVKSSGEYSNERKAQIGVVTSVAGTAGLGVAPAYSATKKMQSTYLSALSQLVRMERLPVCLSDIRPGFVATEFLNPEKKYPMMITVDDAATHILKGLERKKRIIIFDWKFKCLTFIWKLIPRPIWERMTFIKN
jgi:short-subunit dehydrogenase